MWDPELDNKKGQEGQKGAGAEAVEQVNKSFCLKTFP